jgi:hypothetical protein
MASTPARILNAAKPMRIRTHQTMPTSSRAQSDEVDGELASDAHPWIFLANASSILTSSPSSHFFVAGLNL